ncbi:MAG: hypothetical protein KDD35_09275, partial [Bdellovibrionales bacterium]|nr:hypothetical protein [Bdellovibrionales bacterium]
MPKKDTGYQHFYPGFRFFCSHNRGFTLSREGNTVSLSVGDISLKGFHLTWSFEKKAIEVITDRLSLYPLLVMPCSDSGLWFSNTSEYFPFIEPNFKLSPLAVNHFFMQCYLMPDHFFLKGVSRISGHWSHEFGKTFEVGSCRWQASDFPQISGDSSDPERGVELFAETLARVMDSGCPERFFFSGGLDSRSIVLAAERRS